MLIKTVLLAAPITSYTAPKDYSSEDQQNKSARVVKKKWTKNRNTKCAALTSTDFWGPGHVVESCTNADKFRKSEFLVQCSPLFIEDNK